MPVVLIVSAFIFPIIFSLLFSKDVDTAKMFNQLRLDITMALLFMVVSSMARTLGGFIFVIVATGMALSAILALIPSLLTLIGLASFDETVYYHTRLHGFIWEPNSPNIFGLYVSVALFLLFFITTNEVTYRFRHWVYMLVPVLVLGVIFSYSRAAWGSTLITLLVLIILAFPNIRKIIIVSAIGVTILGIALYPLLIHQPLVTQLLINRIGIQHYDEERFAGQKAALIKSLHTPLGIGAGQDELVFGTEIHSTYLRLLTENGWMGFSVFLVFWVFILKS
jgi:hypothetical protein